MSEITIREANVEDADAILRIYIDSYRDICPGKDYLEIVDYDRRVYGEKYPFLSSQNLREWILHKGENEFMVIAQVEERIVGFIKFSIFIRNNSRIGYVEEIHVDRKHRGRGIGGILLENAEKKMIGLGARIAYLEAWSGALEWFIKKGYIPLGWEPKPYMGIVRYIDLIKLLDQPKILYYAMKNLHQGNYRKVANILKKVMDAAESIRHENNDYLCLLYMYPLYIAEDLKAQDYYSLAKRIRETAKKFSPPLSYIFESLALEVEGEAEEYLYNHRIAYRKFSDAVKRLRYAVDRLKREHVLTFHPLSILLDLLECKAACYASYAIFCGQRSGLLSDEDIDYQLSKIEEMVEKCRKFPSLIADINHILLRIR